MMDSKRAALSARRMKWGSVAHGALVDLITFLPFVVAVAVARHHGWATQESYVWVASVLAVIVAPVIGGMAAAHRQPQAPLLHGAAAAFAAALGYVAFRVIDGLIGGRSANAGGLVFFVQLSVIMGIAGGYLAFRNRVPS
jgi:hypothetical protein